MPSPKQPALQYEMNPSATKLASIMHAFPLVLFDIMASNVQETFEAFEVVMEKRTSVGPLYRRTGRLTRSWWTSDPEGRSLATFNIKMGSFSPKSLKHEIGGTFYPRGAQQSEDPENAPPTQGGGAQWFWIPLGSNLKANRTAKVSPKKALELIKQGLWRFAHKKKEDADLGSGKSKRVVVVVVAATDEKVFLLVKQIYLKPQLAFSSTSLIFVQRAYERLVKLSGEKFQEQFAGIAGTKQTG